MKSTITFLLLSQSNAARGALQRLPHQMLDLHFLAWSFRFSYRYRPNSRRGKNLSITFQKKPANDLQFYPPEKPLYRQIVQTQTHFVWGV